MADTKFYSIDPQPIVLSKMAKRTKVKIFGWSNNRHLFIDREKQETYFQVTIEGHNCENCPLWKGGFKLIGWKTHYTFCYVGGYVPLFQRLEGVPDNLSLESLGKFLGLYIAALVT